MSRLTCWCLAADPLNVREKAQIASLEMSDCVVSLPIVSDELLAEAYAGAKLFVYPSLNEGFGFPPLEAMSVGCPVLASRVSSIPEICQDAPFYFDPIDQGSFNRALLHAVSDEGAREASYRTGQGSGRAIQLGKVRPRNAGLVPRMPITPQQHGGERTGYPERGETRHPPQTCLV